MAAVVSASRRSAIIAGLLILLLALLQAAGAFLNVRYGSHASSKPVIWA